MKAIDEFYHRQPEPQRACFLFLREFILGIDPLINESLKYGMPFFSVNGKMFCYLWFHKKYRLPYFGIVEGTLVCDDDFIAEKRARMKILLIESYDDLPLGKIQTTITALLPHYI